MNTVILVGIGIVWSAISGAIGGVVAWVVKGHRDEMQFNTEAARAEKWRVACDVAKYQRDQAMTERDALQAQCKDVIARNVVLVGQVKDRDEAIDALQLQLAEATAKNGSHAQIVPKRPRKKASVGE